MLVLTCRGSTLDGEVGCCFGLNDYFLWVDQEGNRVEAEPNRRRFSAKGVGEAAARRIAGQGATAVITGSITTQAAGIILQAGIRVFVGAAGPARAVLKAYQAGWLRPLTGREEAGGSNGLLFPTQSSFSA